MKTITNTIARAARTNLGRPAITTGRTCDSAAMDAVKTAAVAAGLTSPLLGWASAGLSVRALAEAYVGRYIQAYGLGVEV